MRQITLIGCPGIKALFTLLEIGLTVLPAFATRVHKIDRIPVGITVTVQPTEFANSIINRFDPSGHDPLGEYATILDEESLTLVDYAQNQAYNDAFTSLIDDLMSGDPEWFPPDQAPVEPSIDPSTNPTGTDTSPSPEAEQPDPTKPQAKTQPETPAKPDTSPNQDPEGPGPQHKPQPPNDKPPCHCQLLGGPTYSPNGIITAQTANGWQSASFDLTATFGDDPNNGVYAHCCEVRQYLSWDVRPPGHLMGQGLLPNTWYEDQDSNGQRYGHRDKPAEPGISQYYLDQANGTLFVGYDRPTIRNDGRPGSGRPGQKWFFKLVVIDRCNGDQQVGVPDFVTVNW